MGRENEKGEEVWNQWTHFLHRKQDRAISYCQLFFPCSFLEDQRSQMGWGRHLQRLGHSMNCAATLATPADGPWHGYPVGNLTLSTPSNLGNSDPFPHPSPDLVLLLTFNPIFTTHWELTVPLGVALMRAGCQRHYLPASHRTVTDVYSPCSGEGNAGPWQICQLG